MRPLGIFLAVGAAFATVPFMGLPAFYESFLYLVFHWIVLATSWNLLSGYSGYFSFGHAAFFGAGVYSTAVLAGKLGWPFLATLPVAAAVPALLGVGLGAVVFRLPALRGELFALITLALMYVFATIVLNTPLDGGPGVYMSNVALPTLAPSPSGSFYLMALVLALGTVGIAYSVYRARFGTGLFAIHDDEDVAEVMGVPTYRYKLAALALSCGLAGLAGGIHGVFVSYVTVGETFSGWMALNVILMAALGGTRHWAGPAVGATAVTLMTFYFTTSDYAIAGRALVGLIFIVVILFMPNGLLGRFAVRKPLASRSDAAVVETIAVQERKEESILVVRGAKKAFKGVQALAGVDLEVRRGEILGLVGPNGSGKSTLINVVSGHYPIDSGSVVFEGRELAGFAPHGIARSGIARTYQIPRPFAHLSVLENVALPPMFGLVAMDRRAAEAEAWRWLEFTGLAAKALRLPRDLNLHERKFLELARALASRPKLIFLDEVLSGLTPAEIDGAIRTIRAIRDQGATVVFVEHVMRAVMELTDRVVVLTNGRTIAQGAPREVMRDQQVIEAYLGLHMRDAPLLEARQLKAGYGAAPAVWDVSLDVREGDLVVVVGPNGAGKTTLINALAGVHPMESGRLSFLGKDISSLAAHRFCDQGIALVPEGRRLFTDMTVRENLELGSYRGAAKAHREASLRRVIARFPMLGERLGQPAGTLSGGQQQMLAIGRALMAQPKLLLLDEPSLGLAPTIVMEMFRIIREVNQEGVAVLLVEQNVAMALDLARRAYVLEEGRIVAEGAPRELAAQPHIQRAYLGH